MLPGTFDLNGVKNWDEHLFGVSREKATGYIYIKSCSRVIIAMRDEKIIIKSMCKIPTCRLITDKGFCSEEHRIMYGQAETIAKVYCSSLDIKNTELIISKLMEPEKPFGTPAPYSPCCSLLSQEFRQLSALLGRLCRLRTW